MELVFLYIFLSLMIIIAVATTIAIINGFSNGEYRKYRRVYQCYRKDVFRDGKNYDRYVRDFKNENIKIKEGNKSSEIHDYNTSYRVLQSLYGLLETRRDIVDKYSKNDKFRYRVEFRAMKKEWESSNICIKERASLENVTFEDMLIADDVRKEELLTLIGKYINPGIKGKGTALLILALERNGYLSREGLPVKAIAKAIEERYKCNLGASTGITDYLSTGHPTKDIVGADIEAVEVVLGIKKNDTI